jgi:hypothetical protein
MDAAGRTPRGVFESFGAAPVWGHRRERPRRRPRRRRLRNCAERSRRSGSFPLVIGCDGRRTDGRAGAAVPRTNRPTSMLQIPRPHGGKGWCQRPSLPSKKPSKFVYCVARPDIAATRGPHRTGSPTSRKRPKRSGSTRARRVQARSRTSNARRGQAPATTYEDRRSWRGTAYAPPLGPVGGASALKLRVMPRAN